MQQETKGRRSRRRSSQQVSGDHNQISDAQLAQYRAPKNPYKPIEILTTDHVNTIHEASLTLLEQTGMKVLYDEGRVLFKAAGAHVDEQSQMVKIDRELLMSLVKKAPSTVKLNHRNPQRSQMIGDGHLSFSAVGGAPNVSDMDRGKRPGTLADFQNFLRLSQSYDVIHLVGGAPEPIDIDSKFRHLHMLQSAMTLTDKFAHVYARGKGAIEDSFEIIRLANGLSEEQFKQGVYCNTVVNTNSPLQLDNPMTQGIIEFARAGQLTIITPFTLSGAMAPVTISGALTLQNAEALFGIALSQIASPGAPVAYGGFTSNVDMKSGSPAFGTPEYTKAAFASGQLARFYNLPWRSSNVNASNAPDAQSAYESQMALWGSIMGGADIIKHAAGWLEGGLTASYEKFIIDVEMLQMFTQLFEPLAMSADDLALEAIQGVGPGGHFFGCEHTMARYKDAFYNPLLSDWQNFGQWSDAGSQDSATRANKIMKKTLADYQPPALEKEREEAIQDFVDRRTREGGVVIL